MKLTIEYMRYKYEGEEYEEHGLSDGESFAPFGSKIFCEEFKQMWEENGKPLAQVLDVVPYSSCTPISKSE